MINHSTDTTMRYSKLLPRKRRLNLEKSFDLYPTYAIHPTLDYLKDEEKNKKVVLPRKRRMKEALKIVAKINKLGWIAKYILKEKYYEPNL